MALLLLVLNMVSRKLKFRNLHKLSLKSVREINGNMEWKFITKLCINSTAFFEPEASELEMESKEQLSPLGKTDTIIEGRE